MHMGFTDHGTCAVNCERRPDLLQRVVILSLALLPCYAGCVPKAVVWLNDSSGVVFTENDGSRLVHYDLKRKASRVICADTETRTPWPAIRADGKQIAVGSVRVKPIAEKNKYLVQQQVLIYDLQGTVVHKSSVREHTVDADAIPRNDGLLETALNWSGPHDKIIMDDCIYDVTKDAWISIDVMPWPVFNMPVSGNGTGFLGGAPEAPAFVDWDGWVSNIESDQVLKGRLPLAFSWQGGTATIVYDVGIMEIDTVQMRSTFTKKQVASSSANGDLASYYDFPQKQTRLCLFQRRAKNTFVNTFELHSIEHQKGRVLLAAEGGATAIDAMLAFFPSPCGKYVAIRVPDGEKRSRIVIYDGGVQPLADIACEN